MSILPKCLVAPELSASTSARREMLQAITWASPPALRIPPATSSQASALRLEITTLAPSFAKSSAEERPMPRLEPVITATLPVRSNGVDCMGTYSLLLVLSFSVLAGLHPARHCERSEAIHSDANEPWIASSLTLLAMTPWAVPNRSDLNQPAA